MIIYKTTNKITGKFYIGQDKNNNSSYLGSGVILKKALKKYGKENFVKEILEHCDSIEILNEREKYYIEKLKAIEFGYNISIGGEGGPNFLGKKHTKESKDKIKATWKKIREEENFIHNMTGFKHSEETKATYSIKRKGKLVREKNGMFGKKHTDEAKLKMSKPQFGEKNGMFGKKHTDEAKKKNSNSHIGEKNSFYGKTHSEESKNKIRNKTKGRKPVNSKKVIVNDVFFESASAAAKYFKISIGTASYRCRKKILNWSFVF